MATRRGIEPLSPDRQSRIIAIIRPSQKSDGFSTRQDNQKLVVLPYGLVLVGNLGIEPSIPEVAGLQPAAVANAARCPICFYHTMYQFESDNLDKAISNFSIHDYDYFHQCGLNVKKFLYLAIWLFHNKNIYFL